MADLLPSLVMKDKDGTYAGSSQLSGDNYFLKPLASPSPLTNLQPICLSTAAQLQGKSVPGYSLPTHQELLDSQVTWMKKAKVTLA